MRSTICSTCLINCFSPRLDTPNMWRTIDSFSESDCSILFKFLRDDLKVLLRLLRIPATMIFDNRSRMPGEEVYLGGLYELINGATKRVVSLTVFGRDWSAQSRAFKCFITNMFFSFKHAFRKGNLQKNVIRFLDSQYL